MLTLIYPLLQRTVQLLGFVALREAARALYDKDIYELLDEVFRVEVVEQTYTHTDGGPQVSEFPSVVKFIPNVAIENGASSVEDRDEDELVAGHIENEFLSDLRDLAELDDFELAHPIEEYSFE